MAKSSEPVTIYLDGHLLLSRQMKVNGLAMAFGKEEGFVFWKCCQAVGGAAFHF